MTSAITVCVISKSCMKKSQLVENSHSRKDGCISDRFYSCTGLAMMGSTCATQFGRTVNNDIGLASAIIIAHEAAHT